MLMRGAHFERCTNDDDEIYIQSFRRIPSRKFRCLRDIGERRKKSRLMAEISEIYVRDRQIKEYLGLYNASRYLNITSWALTLCFVCGGDCTRVSVGPVGDVYRLA